MRKEMDILRKEVEFQKKLADYWEEWWKQEYAEKIELLHKNMELEKKYEEISEEVQNKFELVHSPSRVTSQDILSNQVRRGEGSSHDTKRKRKAISEDELVMKDKREGEKKEWTLQEEMRSC